MKVKKSVTTDYSLTLTRADLIDILRDSKISLSPQIPEDAEVTITVPSGGDFCGDCLDLDEVGGLTITWTTEG